ncbi:probable DNA-directed RNA polymerases I and III subunit RPAC2 [Bactrocera neohumeralis]|uniref:probable DNA-directed RNA polymerases I and III subunit RPAC2 n=1 Tax=Bactrocera tryoni TaxID=59916 RepID=UPI001A979F13|nr:probable DNA-directed RNA polymerases I and III subunit RPAC2 [Bactrocera tryoni]XP_050319647.1 probable DNA-directed RNA polymerases I and III subunit RPAC2 [Bactrocera neohumeralis]
MGALAEVAGDENSGEGSRTFVFQNEGHTLGNALKTIISRYPDVEFCGYTIPHPTESKMHFRIQSNQNRAIDILKRGLDDLESLCDHTISTFESEVKTYIETNNKPAVI